MLYVIGTPIGNLEDISFRATRVLNDVDLILAEDTRKAKILLDKYKIKTPVISYHQHSSSGKIDFIIQKLSQGKDLAMISDAGTPGISDPGNKLIESLICKMPDLPIIPIPGANAASSALSISGFPTDRFLFLGFLPKKKGRQTLFKNLQSELTNLNIQSIVFYESPYRIVKTLNDIRQVFGNKEIVVCRELTKKFETVYRGNISDVICKIKPKGEFTVIIKCQ